MPLVDQCCWKQRRQQVIATVCEREVKLLRQRVRCRVGRSFGQRCKVGNPFGRGLRRFRRSIGRHRGVEVGIAATRADQQAFVCVRQFQQFVDVERRCVANHIVRRLNHDMTADQNRIAHRAPVEIDRAATRVRMDRLERMGRQLNLRRSPCGIGKPSPPVMFTDERLTLLVIRLRELVQFGVQADFDKPVDQDAQGADCCGVGGRMGH